MNGSLASSLEVVCECQFYFMAVILTYFMPFMLVYFMWHQLEKQLVQLLSRKSLVGALKNKSKQMHQQATSLASTGHCC